MFYLMSRTHGETMGREVDSGGIEGPRKRANTATSSFGVSKREGHDSSQYYAGRMYQGLNCEHDTGKANQMPADRENVILCADSRSIDIPDNTVHLMVTSPPYNASKDYDEDLSLQEYLTLLREVFTECHRVLVPGGRAIVNVANLGRKPYIPLSSHINNIMQDIGFLMRGEIIWNKAASAGSSCAWGSYKSASNPCLRDIHEYILVYSKGEYKLPRTKQERAEGRDDSISKEDFIAQTKSIWSFATESAKRVKHPAPFPVELPRRCIEMYSFTGDIILDPFLGSGSTAIAAIRTGRRYIGVDISEEYCKIAEQRITEELVILKH